MESPLPQKTLEDRIIYLSRNDFGFNPNNMGAPVITDFGLAVPGEGRIHNHCIQPDGYRAPEVLLGAGWGYSADIWNLGLLLWDLLEDHGLFFDPQTPQYSDERYLARIIAILGPPPPELLAQGKETSQYFDDEGKFKFTELVPDGLRLEDLLANVEGQEKTMFAKFIRRMICWKPEDRSTAKELFTDPWLDGTGLCSGLRISAPPKFVKTTWFSTGRQRRFNIAESNKMSPQAEQSKRKENTKRVNGKRGKPSPNKSQPKKVAHNVPPPREQFLSSSLPTPLQQLILNIFKSALLPQQSSSEAQSLFASLTEHIQAIKAHLYQRDFVKAFAEADEHALRAYALRWSAGRALGYAAVFRGLKELLFRDGHVHVLCVGGGAGAEIMALAGVWRALWEEEQETSLSERVSGLDLEGAGVSDGQSCKERLVTSSFPKLNATAIDIADWSGVVACLSDGMKSKLVPSMKDYPAPLLPDDGETERFAVKFAKEDVLGLSEDDLTHLLYPPINRETVSTSTLVTLMFTLNELFSTSIPKTVSFLLRLTDILKAGAVLLIVDSPGSYSTVSLGSKDPAEVNESSQRKYPMRFLLEHTLLSVATEKWECMLCDESRWFRRDKDALVYDVGEGIGLEDMRYQIHIYRRL
ncbi:conserved hypothetical protein [Uncinocarpus reesii 1704]|uniref:Protein kinase domain-containing protein n=1 Tax=Uncinocarpus reesii (strain UAMH 1704) TaxID=336963 RepID=C4JPQ9_UNCRE|nr:uncharacterized protein UREG_04552 [Uncinocarpus reesii 1704]EEP79706.1 conserved hypothetical protein [Uncinocarpus reesii 1704]